MDECSYNKREAPLQFQETTLIISNCSIWKNLKFNYFSLDLKKNSSI